MDDDSEEARKRAKEREMEQEEDKKWAHVMPRWQTRLFAVECIRRLLAVLDDPAHFSLALAREAPGRDLAVHKLADLVTVACRAATAAIDAMRPAGVLTLIEVVEKLGGADDPDYDGKLLLEQYLSLIHI